MPVSPEPVPLPSTPEAFEALLYTTAGSFHASNDPLQRYLVAAKQNLSNSDTVSVQQVIDNFRPSVATSISQKATVLVIPSNSSSENDDGLQSAYAAAVLWFTPDHPRGPRAITPESSRPFIEYAHQSEVRKAEALQGRKRYYYIHIISRSPRNMTKGAISALLKWGLDRAKSERVPVYLEATNEHARDVYAHFGFRVTGELVVGIGEVDRKGFWVAKEKGGDGDESKAEGVKCWCMIWEP